MLHLRLCKASQLHGNSCCSQYYPSIHGSSEVGWNMCFQMWSNLQDTHLKLKCMFTSSNNRRQKWTTQDVYKFCLPSIAVVVLIVVMIVEVVDCVVVVVVVEEVPTTLKKEYYDVFWHIIWKFYLYRLYQRISSYKITFTNSWNIPLVHEYRYWIYFFNIQA